MIQANQINLDDRIYPLSLVNKAIDDYRDIVKIHSSYITDSHKVLLDFSEFSLSFTVIKDEFCNYLIDLVSTSSGYE